MRIKNYLLAGALSTLSLSTALSALSPEKELQIRQEIRTLRYKQLGDLLKQELNQSQIQLEEIHRIASEEKAAPLLHALSATSKFQKEHEGLGMSAGNFLQTALFIESDLAKYSADKKYYLDNKKVRLPRTIEYDPHNKAVFIVLDGTKSAYLGAGAKKTAYRSIFYNNRDPKVVARAQQLGNMKKELRITRQLRGLRGIYSTEGAGEHVKKGQIYTAIYSKLYNAGDLKGAFEKKTSFTLDQKVKIALDIMYGLEALHKQKIAHRDLGSKNFFLNRTGDQAFEAVIADFGWSNYVKDIPHRKAQANFKNTAPEGFDFTKLKGADYYRTDVFATGLVLYQLVYGEKVAWKGGFKKGTPTARRKKLVRSINVHTQSNRLRLTQLKTAGTITKKEGLELVVLRMLNPDPKKRPSAATLRRELQQLHDKP